MISNYDVEIDADGDGSSLCGTVMILGHEHKISMDGSGRDLFIELDGEPADEELEEGLGDWLDPYDAVEPILTEVSGEKYSIEDWSGRVVNGEVVRLVVRDGRELKVVRGALVDDSILPKILLAIESGMTTEQVEQTLGAEVARWFVEQADRLKPE